MSGWDLLSPEYQAGRPGSRVSDCNLSSSAFSRLRSMFSSRIASNVLRSTMATSPVYTVRSSPVQSCTPNLAPIFEAENLRSCNARYPRLPYAFISQQYNPCG